MRTRNAQPAASGGQSRFWHRLRGISLWSVAAGVIAFAIVFGLQPWVIGSAGFALLYAGIHRAASKRVEELVERKPDLQLVVSNHAFVDGTVTPSMPSPWPVDTQRVVINDVQDLRENADAHERLARSPVHLLSPYLDSPLAIRPGRHAYERARARFDEAVVSYEADLRQWLMDYQAAADRRSRTFELDLAISSGRRGAYAERVMLAIDLPAGVELVSERPTITPPPEQPEYVPPRPRSLSEDSRAEFALGRFPSPLIPPVSNAPHSIWQLTSSGRRVETPVGDIHHGRPVELTEPLLVRVPGEGRHEIRWTLFIKSSRRLVGGSFRLVMPASPARPAFTRLHGIESFPDVSFVDEDGSVVRRARTTDPPTYPPEPLVGVAFGHTRAREMREDRGVAR